MKNATIHTFLITLCFLLASSQIHSQPICKIEHFSGHKELAQRTVTDIAQDKKGFIWFSTWNGLNKFDGYTFKNYKAYPGDSCTLTSNRIIQCIPNQSGNIWCKSHHNRIYLFDVAKEDFIDLLLPIEQKNHTNYPVVNIFVLSKAITWITCENGAFRIDENLFLQDSNHPEAITFFSAENKRLPDNQIELIKEDSEGDEWILTSQGTVLIGQKQISQHIAFTEACENNQKMYLRTVDHKLGLYDFRNTNLRFREIPFSYHRINHLTSIGNDSIGICTDQGFMLYLASRKEFIKLNIPTANHNISQAYKDGHNNLWFFSDQQGVIRYDLTSNESEYYPTFPKKSNDSEEQSIQTFFEDNQGTLWIIPQQGIICYYERQKDQLLPYYTDYEDKNSIFNPTVLRYYIDRQKNFWYANTYELGRISFFPNASQAQYFDHGLETRAFLIDKEEQLWAANKKGIIRIYHPDQSLKGYLAPDGSIRQTETAFHQNIYSCYEDKHGNIWLGSRWNGIYLLKKKSDYQYAIRHFAHDEHNPFSLNNNSIYDFFEDSQQRMWICTHGGGLNLLQQTADGKIQFIHNGNQLSYPKNKFSKVRTIKEVNQCLLVGTTEGLLTFSSSFTRPDSIHFYENTRIPNDISSLSSNDVTSIFTDSKNITYALSFTGGINQIISDTLLSDRIRFQSYTKKDGLPSDLVLSMVEDNQHRLWVIAENNLIEFKPSRKEFVTYKEQYLQNELYFSEAQPIFHDNQLILGTESGFLRIHPSVFKKSQYAPSIVFTGFKIHGVNQPVQIDNIEQLEIHPKERNISLQFAALDYVAPEKIHYAYRLKGLEDKWNHAETSRTANYINLPPGDYVLEIHSTNSDGIWTNNVRSLPIKVIPTFWETYWAQLLYVVFFMLSASIIIYVIVYIYQLRHQISLEQQLTRIKLRFFTDISHELRTPLTLISSPVTEILEHEDLSESARKHLTLVHKNTERMLSLINQILDFRKIENNKMKLLLERTDMTTITKQVMDNFMLIAEEKSIKFELIEQQHATIWIDRDKVEKIVFNLLSNAFKYTPDHKSITVIIDTEEPWLTISVKDEGMGIDKETQNNLFQRFETLVHRNILQPSSGIGLSLVKELIELHHGEIRVNSEKGKGSEFIVCLPLDKNTYTPNEMTEFIANDADSCSEKQINYAESDSEQPSDSENLERTTILIVEDNDELRNFLIDILSLHYQIISACNGQEGLEQALDKQPDLIISDVMMPVMDGIEMVKAIKGNHDSCHIPIILLSAKSSLSDRIEGIEQGIDDYVTKPFSSTYLKTRIKTLLQQREELQKHLLEQWSKQQTQPAENKPIELEPERPHITSFDQLFMQRIMDFMEKEMDNANLTVDEMAQAMGMGRTVFNQKLKSVLGLSPVEFIREIRIKRAKQLIESKEYNISSIAYMTGFNDPKYFSKCFKKTCGITPTEYQKQIEQA